MRANTCSLGALTVLLLSLSSCGGNSSTSAPPTSTPTPPTQTSPTQITITTIATGFNTPVDLQQPNDNSGRLFVVEKPGTIRVIQNGSVLPSPFLDITSKVDSSSGEMGLLGLAFHPSFAQSRRFIVHYDRTVNGQIQSVIAEYLVSASDANHADPTSERILLTVNQPFSNHKGGQLAFGPDGFLYIALGDGGSEGDPQGNGQNVQTLLGKILRINVDARTATAQYAIPADNPFARGGGAPEIFAYGFRNPWRFSFDKGSGHLFAGDVGQDKFEEVDIVQRGGNFGWSITEGNHCFKPPSGCNMAGLTAPIAEYDHSEGNAVIGGYVYSGASIPSLQGAYIFGDLGNGKVWTLRESSSGTWTRADLLTVGSQITSFGQDQAGEVFVVELGGRVSRITAQ